MGPMSDRVVDAKGRFAVCRLVHGRRRVRIGEVSLTGTVQRAWVAVEICPACAARADGRELEVRRVGAGTLEHGILGVLVYDRGVVASDID